MKNLVKDLGKRVLRGALQTKIGAISPPYDYVGAVCESYLHAFVASPADEIRSIIVVGGCDAAEVTRMAPRYRNAVFHVFEPSPRNFPGLAARFAHHDRVHCVQMAVSNAEGMVAFHEANLDPCGSLLPIGDAARRDYQLREAGVIEVRTTTLDSYLSRMAADIPIVDMLWCDVQGAEMLVLGGAMETLSRTRALFLEVAMIEPQYEGGCLYREIEAFVGQRGFVPVLMGTDPLNFTGNVLFVHPERRGQHRLKM
jgi:FkbM family methyltransferase